MSDTTNSPREIILNFIKGRKGEQKAGAKYIKRELINDRWKYWYEKEKSQDPSGEPDASLFQKIAGFFKIDTEKAKSIPSKEYESHGIREKGISLPEWTSHFAKYFQRKAEFDAKFNQEKIANKIKSKIVDPNHKKSTENVLSKKREVSTGYKKSVFKVLFDLYGEKNKPTIEIEKPKKLLSFSPLKEIRNISDFVTEVKTSLVSQGMISQAEKWENEVKEKDKLNDIFNLAYKYTSISSEIQNKIRRELFLNNKEKIKQNIQTIVNKEQTTSTIPDLKNEILDSSPEKNEERIKEALVKNAFEKGSDVILKSSFLKDRNLNNVSSPSMIVKITDVKYDENLNHVVYSYEDKDGGMGFAPESEFESLPIEEASKIENVIKNVTPETRKKANRDLFGQQNQPVNRQEYEQMQIEEKSKVSHVPKTLSLSTGDFTYLWQKNIHSYLDMNEDDVMYYGKNPSLKDASRPAWMPDFWGSYNKYKVPKVEVEFEGKRCYLCSFKSKNSLTASYFLFSAKQVAAIESFHYQRDLAAYNAKEHYGTKPKVLSKNKVLATQYDLVKNVLAGRQGIEPSKISRTQILSNLNTIESEYSFRVADIVLDKEDIYDSTFTKGQETSYGDSGTVDDLKNQFGVLVKMQNGNDVDPKSLKQIQEQMTKLFGVYGDRSEMSSKFGLKISHAGEKRQHARKAIGIFSPSHRAIGVSFIDSDDSSGITLAHEFAHFIDHYLAKESNSGRYASSGYGIENEIANTFRKGIGRDFKAKAYWSRSCECFARAFECYYAKKTGLEIPDKGGANPKEEFLTEKVFPLIDKFFEEKNEFLKSKIKSAFDQLTITTKVKKDGQTV